MNSPQQELYSKLLVDLRQYFKKSGYGVYDGTLPPEDTTYPFVYFGDFRQNDMETKSQTIGSVFPTIHVWHNNPRQRGKVSMMLLAIVSICKNVRRTENFSWLIKDVSQNIIPDSTTKTPLLHGIFEAEFKFS